MDIKEINTDELIEMVGSIDEFIKYLESSLLESEEEDESV